MYPIKSSPVFISLSFILTTSFLMAGEYPENSKNVSPASNKNILEEEALTQAINMSLEEAKRRELTDAEEAQT